MRKSSRQAKTLLNNHDVEHLPFLVLLCAGEGRRFGRKKQLLTIEGLPLFFHTLLAFAGAQFSYIVLVVPQQNLTAIAKSLPTYTPPLKSQQQWWNIHKNRLHIIAGGQERYISSANAIAWLSENAAISDKNNQTIVIHDGARALLDKKDLIMLLKKWGKKPENCGGIVAAKMLTDTIKRVKTENQSLWIKEHSSRKDFMAVSTPQIFSFTLLQKAYEKMVKEKNIDFTDDSEVMEKYSPKPCLIELHILEKSNPKLTYNEDLLYFTETFKRRLNTKGNFDG